MTLEAAARAGVREAQEWLRTGRPPLQPEFRLAEVSQQVEFKPGFGQRGNIGVVMMSVGQ